MRIHSESCWILISTVGEKDVLIVLERSSEMRTGYLLICMVIFSIIGALATAVADLEEGLVVYFNFDQGKTDVVKDISRAGNDGAVHGNPKWVQGPKAELGKAIELDGESDYIEVPDNDTMEVGDGDITMMFWVMQAGEQVAHPRPVSKMPLFGTNEPGFEVIAYAPPWIFYGMSGGDRQEVKATSDILDGEWHHLAAMKDKNEGKIYIDGEVSVNIPITPIDISNDYPFIVGGNAQPQVHTMFKGVLDEVAFYTRALTEEEIEEAMLKGIYTSVEPGDKLAATWASLKTQR